MNHDEQRVRTVAGWIGVEISRSRVRTVGKAGYGLYRVRTAAERHWHGGQPPVVPAGEWTAYAFTLEEIGAAVRKSIERGLPRTPQVLRLGPADDPTWVPTRWTQAYRGRRDLGVWMQRPGLCGRPERHVDECECLADGKARWIEDEPIPVALKPEFVALVTAVDSLVGAGLVTMVHVEGCDGTECGPDRYWAACIQATATDRQVQRAQNAAFQAEHLKAREWGLRARYAAKRGRLGRSQHSDEQLGPESGSEGDSAVR